MRAERNLPLSFLLPNWVNAPVLSVVVANEIRAVFPAWVILMLVTALGFLPRDLGISFAVLAYTLGCSAIGSIAAGHDFTHRTLSATLSQPFARERLWRIRMRIAFAGSFLLFALVLVMLSVKMQGTAFLNTPGWILALLVAPMLVGLCVAPWITLVCRNALAGTVFTVAIPYVVSGIAVMIPLFSFPVTGLGAGGYVSLQISACLLLLGVCWFGWHAGRRKFLALEAVEIGGFLPRNRKIIPSERREVIARSPKDMPGSPWWRLIHKELRLQLITLLPAAGLWVTLLTWQLRGDISDTLPMISFFWALMTCLLVGALGSAEERQLGISEWQALAPVAAWRQWALKCVVLFAWVALLVLVVPGLIVHRGSWDYSLAEVFGAARWFAPFMVMMVAVCLYVSSLSGTTIQAVLISLPSCGAMLWAATLMNFRLDRNFGRPPVRNFDENHAVLLPPLAVIVFFLLLLLWFAGKNHFSAERGMSRIARQIGWTFGATLLASVVAMAAWIANH
jgi:hypothetical protein